MSELPHKFIDLPAELFPFAVKAFREGKLIWECVVTGPGAVVVPGLRQPGQSPVNIEITYANGWVERR